jgi:hypothetical protein
LRESLKQEDRKYEAEGDNSTTQELHIALGGLIPEPAKRRMEDVIRDLRFGCCMLAKSPVFAFIAVASVAIGTGANCAVFTFADTLLLRPLTIARADEVVRLGFQDSFRGA